MNKNLKNYVYKKYGTIDISKNLRKRVVLMNDNKKQTEKEIKKK